MNISGIIWPIVTIAWMGLIFYLSSLSGQDVSRAFPFKPISSVGHIILFAWLAIFLQLSIRGWGFEINLRCVVLVSIICSLYGISDEYHQSFVRGRHASISDASVDAISSTAAAVLTFIGDRFTSSRNTLQ